MKANAAPPTNIAVDRHNGGINAIPRFAAGLGAMNVQDQASRSRALQYSGVEGSNIALEGGVARSLIHIGFRPFAADTPVHHSGASAEGRTDHNRPAADHATDTAHRFAEQSSSGPSPVRSGARDGPHERSFEEADQIIDREPRIRFTRSCEPSAHAYRVSVPRSSSRRSERIQLTP